MAPEVCLYRDTKYKFFQVINNEKHTNSVDIVAFGLILYEMLTEKLITSDEINPLSRIDINALHKCEAVQKFPELEEIVKKCLSMKFSERPTAEAIEKRLMSLTSEKDQEEMNIHYIIQWIINRVYDSNTRYKYNPNDKVPKM